MKPVTRNVLIVGSLALLTLGGYLYWKYKNPTKEDKDKDNQSEGEGNDATVVDKPPLPTPPNEGRPNRTLQEQEFINVKKNLGLNISSKGNVVSVKFNGGKNSADFYNNNRVIIGTVGKAGYLKKGSYSNGGKTISLDNGKEINSGSVWGNLLNSLK